MKDKSEKHVMLREGHKWEEEGKWKSKEVNMVDAFLFRYEYETFRPVEITIRRETKVERE
jgi:hypothetical protein